MIDEELISQDIDKFRRASRELFNNYFRVEDARAEGFWHFDAFKEVEALLFAKLVLEPNEITGAEYGKVNTHIGVVLRPDFSPIMVNREQNKSSGYWDFATGKVTKDVRLSFNAFFDWDALRCCDNQYVRVTIEEWPSHPEATGRQALIEVLNVSYRLVR